MCISILTWSIENKGDKLIVEIGVDTKEYLWFSDELFFRKDKYSFGAYNLTWESIYS